ncbi:Bug family tripartite tricarboxylate transporter substrate binding protein [Bordetella genomosp. 13]|uniref:Bug family tripartite tricarboxylate transporter substrate binding protein n=1 Tax=Bordetella genomosp. 13 TaxID=463040 RepID=UPI0011A8A161|nr:tripartite tricarboxylate transporter substrate binding protein [Bordetella genomosp. 13]
MKRIMSAALSLAALIGASPLAAAAYPEKPVRIVVAYQAGQGTDVATRYMAEKLSAKLGQPFIVENRGGAGGNIGTDVVARAEPDGYTLTMGTNATHALNEFLYPQLTFDAKKDFAPIALVATFPMALMVAADSKMKSVGDLLEAARRGKGAADVGMPSTTAQLVLELMKEQTKAPLFGVPYKGSPTAVNDVMGGQIPVLIDTVAVARAQVAGGKLRALAVTSQGPTDLLPGVPSVAQQGVPDFEVIAWNALFAPKGTPRAVVDRLNQAVNQILQEPETRARLLQLGYEPAGGSAKDLAEFAEQERAKWGPIIRKAGIRAG